jgi:hypothetical protein
MSKLLSNFTRKAEQYGDVHFISFLGAILSRLAYKKDADFITCYKQIMGSVILPSMMTAIDRVPANNLAPLLDDQTLFALNTTGPLAPYSYTYKGAKYLDVLKLNIPQNVNIINGDLQGNLNFVLTEPQPPVPVAQMVKYISIGWSNYGEVYVVADKRMPKTIFLIFRGTYSAKTAGLYTKPTSLVPLEVCPGEKFLYGIFKPTAEMIHTLVETIRYLAVDFLNATEANSVKIFTTGHSLGGAMCSIFAYLWTTTVTNTPVYKQAPYNVLSPNLVCVSLGAPRCFGKQPARKFCDRAMKNQILYLRIVTKGDPVTALPLKVAGFDHPCSDKDTDRTKVVEMCSATLTMRPKPNISYTSALDCQNETLRPYGPNPFSHTVYLDIIFTYAVDIGKFLKGIGTSQEVLRDKDKYRSTVCRLVMGFNNEFKDVFFNVNQAREAPSDKDDLEEKKAATESPSSIEMTDLSSATTLGQQGGGLFNNLFSKSNPTPPITAATAKGVTLPAPAPATATKLNVASTQPAPKPSATIPEASPKTSLSNRLIGKIKSTVLPTSTTKTTTPSSVTTTATTAQAAQSATKTAPSVLSSLKPGGSVAEDVWMTRQAFNRLIAKMVPVSPQDATPLSGKIENPFVVTDPKEPKMPKLDCPPPSSTSSQAPVAANVAVSSQMAVTPRPAVTNPSLFSKPITSISSAITRAMPRTPATVTQKVSASKGGKPNRKTHKRARSHRTLCNKKRRSCYRSKKRFSRHIRRSSKR